MSLCEIGTLIHRHISTLHWHIGTHLIVIVNSSRRRGWNGHRKQIFLLDLWEEGVVLAWHLYVNVIFARLWYLISNYIKMKQTPCVVLHLPLPPASYSEPANLKKSKDSTESLCYKGHFRLIIMYVSWKNQKGLQRFQKSCKILTLLEETCSFLTKHEAEKEEDDADDEQNRDRGHQGHLEEKEVKHNVGEIFPDTWFLRVLYLMHFRVVHFSLGWKKLAKVRPSNSMK